MRIQLTLALLFISTQVMAVDNKSMQDLFKKYDSVMDDKKVELIDEVFTEKFIKESGGKKELMEKIKELPSEKEFKSKPEMSWRKGLKGEIYFATLKTNQKNKKKNESDKAEFIVLEQNGKLKIDGTISDSN